MNRSSNSHSSMFLMEMMIAILFFSLASAVCLRMFTKSHQMSEDTRNLNMAVNQIQNAAELLKHSYTPKTATADTDRPDFPELFLATYPDAAADTQELSIYFDENWNHCPADQGIFCMKISQNEADEISAYEILVLDAADTEVSSLDLKLHQPNRP